MENEVEYRDKYDPEYIEIKGADFMDFLEYMKDKDLYNIRLPVNNPEAYQYLRWLNAHYHEDYGCFLNYVLNGWDAFLSKKPVRPPTPREVAIFSAKRIVELAERKEKDVGSESDRALFIDTNAEFIRDAYLFWSYPMWINSGLAGCVMKWGTFEDNEKPGDSEKYDTYEEYES